MDGEKAVAETRVSPMLLHRPVLCLSSSHMSESARTKEGCRTDQVEGTQRNVTPKALPAWMRSWGKDSRKDSETRKWDLEEVCKLQLCVNAVF